MLLQVNVGQLYPSGRPDVGKEATLHRMSAPAIQPLYTALMSEKNEYVSLD